MATGKLLAGAAIAAVLLAAALTWQHETPPPSPSSGHTAASNSQGWSLLALGGGNEDGERPSPAQARPVRPPQDLMHDLFTEGSLREASLDGDWGRWTGDQLMPTLALRRRFDQLLTTVGEASLPELRDLVAWMSEQDLGPQGAQAVLSGWDRYVRLQQHSFRDGADPAQPQRWGMALAEHQRVRREILGPAWADAFYREDEAAVRQLIERSPSAPTHTAPTQSWIGPPPAGVTDDAWHLQRMAALGPEAADRLRALELAEADWQHRFEQARAQIQKISRAPELSSEQRAQLIERQINERFEVPDRQRARALLGL